jgi:hypothetical protein
MTIASKKTIIYQYRLMVTDKVQDFEWPVDASIIKVAQHHGDISMWVEQKESNQDAYENRSFLVVPTGVMFPREPHYRYLDTVFDTRGLVWHVYEV